VSLFFLVAQGFFYFGAGEKGDSPVRNHFVGTIEKEINGDLRIEGYLFDSQGEARLYSRQRLARCVNRILILTLGKFEATEIYSSRPK